jgi:hypothetical protein
VHRQIPSPFPLVFAKVSVLLVLDLRRGHFSPRFSVHRSEFSFVVLCLVTHTRFCAAHFVLPRLSAPKCLISVTDPIFFIPCTEFLSRSSFSRWGFSSTWPQLHFHKLAFVSAFLFAAGLASTLGSSTAVGSILLKLARIYSLF